MSHPVSPSPDSQAVDQQQLTHILENIINIQTQHTLMLKQVLDAATRPMDEKSPVATALEALVSSTNAQTSALKALMDTMHDLPAKIGTTMKTEIDNAMKIV